jgi:hypothetical protein
MSDSSSYSSFHGADINLVAPSDAFSLNAPYASYEGAFTVLAHGPSQKGEMFVYSRADCKDSSCTQIDPHSLASNIKVHPNYHEGQAVALFACNAGKWGDQSYAQALANEMGVKVIAPNENIVGLLAIGTEADKGIDVFNGWVVAKQTKEVDVSEPTEIINILGNVIVGTPKFNRIISDPNGALRYLNIDGQGKFEVFSPIRQINIDTQSSIDSANSIAAKSILALQLNKLHNDGYSPTETNVIKNIVSLVIDSHVTNNNMPDIQMNQDIAKPTRETEHS